MPAKWRTKDPYDPEYPIVKLALLVEPQKTFTLQQLAKMTEFRIDRVRNALRKYEVEALECGEFDGRDIIQAAKSYLSTLYP